MTNTQRLIGIIDSNDKHRAMLSDALSPFYEVKTWDDVWKALKDIAEKPPAVILVASSVSPGSPLHCIKQLRKIVTLDDRPILYLAAEQGSGKTLVDIKEAGAQSYMKAPINFGELKDFVSKNLNAGIERDWEALPDLQRDALKNSVNVFNGIADSLMTGEPVSFTDVKDNCKPLVEAIGNNEFKGILDGVRNHDDYTYAHSMRVATMLSLLGHAAGFSEPEQLMLASGGLLHDVGKMEIPLDILNKPGRLDEEEYEIIKSHVPKTIDYLNASDSIPKAVFVIAEQHHEKIDGTGYPHNLAGKQLNELARMAAVVDVFSALTDRRVYKPPMEAEKAFGIMTDGMSNHLDQNYVQMFRGILGDSKMLA
ncbi:MAG: HD-GYP domain-containing protein [Alphaproteobacteria bacterium]|nr:HD-GYP domain-containing protein [Alphaproteobacteria bacterium]